MTSVPTQIQAPVVASESAVTAIASIFRQMASLANSNLSPEQADGFLEPLVVNPKNKHTHTLILLHGRGDHPALFGMAIQNVATSLDLICERKASESPSRLNTSLPSIYPGMKLIFPGAKPRQAKTVMPVDRDDFTPNTWFDFFGVVETLNSETQAMASLRDACDHVHDIIRQELSVLQDPSKIILGGFSQGASAAIYALLTLDLQSLLSPSVFGQLSATGKTRLGGFVGFGGRMPLRSHLEIELPELTDEHICLEERIEHLNTIRDLVSMDPFQEGTVPVCLNTPIYIAHGGMDDVIPISHAEYEATVLRQLGMDVTFKRYDYIGHTFPLPDQMADMVAFFQRKVRLFKLAGSE